MASRTARLNPGPLCRTNMTDAMWWSLVLSIAIPAFVAQGLIDAVVSREYRDARPSWEADGRPRGFAWRAPEQNFFVGGTAARLKVMNRWLFADPPWATVVIRRLLRAYRAASAVQLVAIVIWLFVDVASRAA
jgi:hypothetical protein